MLLSNYENCTNIKLSQTSFCNSNSSASVQFSGTKIVLQIMIVQTWPRSSWFGSQNQNHFKFNCKFLFDAYFLTNSTVDPTIYRSRMMLHKGLNVLIIAWTQEFPEQNFCVCVQTKVFLSLSHEFWDNFVLLRCSVFMLKYSQTRSFHFVKFSHMFYNKNKILWVKNTILDLWC